MKIGKYRLEQTCGACPEQYDVLLNGNIVGYLRLRHGSFTAEAPYCGGKTVYRANPDGDGIFEDHERYYFLSEAVGAIDAHYTTKPKTIEQVCGRPPGDFAKEIRKPPIAEPYPDLLEIAYGTYGSCSVCGGSIDGKPYKPGCYHCGGPGCPWLI